MQNRTVYHAKKYWKLTATKDTRQKPVPKINIALPLRPSGLIAFVGYLLKPDACLTCMTVPVRTIDTIKDIWLASLTIRHVKYEVIYSYKAVVVQ